MRKRRMLAGVLVLCVALVTMASPAFALSFSDVEGDPTVSWAQASIERMTQAGYIKGYEDGTYRPYRSISKLECLLLMARILGAEEANYAKISSEAKKVCGETVSKYNTAYLNELCYLLYTGVLSESDLMTYASAANANTELFRHQAAILMAKMMGRNDEAKNFDATSSEYADSAFIPMVARPYVEFVTAEGIMNGMDKTESGEPQFSPTTSLTRAQMATLLARMIDRLDKQVYTATVEKVNAEESVLYLAQNGAVSKKEINQDTIVRKDGEIVNADALKAGAEITVLEIDGHIQLALVGEGGTAVKPVNNGTVVYAKVSQLAASSTGKKVTLADTEDSTNTATYTTTEDCKFVVRGATAGFNDIKKGDFVKVLIKDGKITSMAVSDKNATIEGVIQAVDFDEENHVYLTVADQDGDVQKYVVSNKGAKVERDEEEAEYRDLAAGDTVTMTLVYGKITAVTATSTAEKFTGVLQEIIIAKKPSVTIVIDGIERNYALRTNAKIKIAGLEADLYDLRPGINVSGYLEGNEVKSLTASSLITDEKGAFAGEVENINTTYKVISVILQDGNKQSVYYNSQTNFLKSNGTEVSARNIEKGMDLSITGVEKNGIFEATIIIIK